MAEKSAIRWTKSTFNGWMGCTRVGPGCDGCYAAKSTPVRTMGIKWGAGEPRKLTSSGNWRTPLKWNRMAPDSEFAGRKGFWPVFGFSLADFADTDVPAQWHRDFENLIYSTPNLSWLLVTKRINNVAKLYPSWVTNGFPANVRILVTVVNQEEADRDIPKLLALNCKNGISYEPALGPVDWGQACAKFRIMHADDVECCGMMRHLDWIIIGGESNQTGHKARPFNLTWARSTIAQCKTAGVPVFVKQLGSRILVRNDSMEEWPDEDAFCDAIPNDYQPQHQGEGVCIQLKDRSGGDPAEWPVDLRRQEFPLYLPARNGLGGVDCE